MLGQMATDQVCIARHRRVQELLVFSNCVAIGGGGVALRNIAVALGLVIKQAAQPDQPGRSTPGDKRLVELLMCIGPHHMFFRGNRRGCFRQPVKGTE